MNVKTFLIKAFWIAESQIRNKGRRYGSIYLAVGTLLLVCTLVFFLFMGHVLQGMEDTVDTAIWRLNEDPTVPKDNGRIELVTSLLLRISGVLRYWHWGVLFWGVTLGCAGMQTGALYLRIHDILNAEQSNGGAVPASEE